MNYPLFQKKQRITLSLEKVLKKKGFPSSINLQIPPEHNGDFAFPCFSYCRFTKKSPLETATEIRDAFEKMPFIEKTEVNGGYINFYVKDTELIHKTISLKK